mgnify:CR=1 FL=1
MDLDRVLRAMAEQEATDLFLKVGNTPFLRLHGKLIPVGEEPLTGEAILEVAGSLMSRGASRISYGAPLALHPSARATASVLATGPMVAATCRVVMKSSSNEHQSPRTTLATPCM